MYLLELGEQHNAHLIYKITMYLDNDKSELAVATVWPRTRCELEYPQYRSPNFYNIPTYTSSDRSLIARNCFNVLGYVFFKQCTVINFRTTIISLNK